MGFIEIQWCSPEYQAALDLRHRVLREPLGMKLTAEELDGEHADMHFGWTDDADQILAVISARPVNSSTMRLRQMAVDPDRQRSGVGTSLMAEVERFLAGREITQLTLHARATAIGFYQRCGYEVVGDEFTEVGLPHRRMSKSTG